MYFKPAVFENSVDCSGPEKLRTEPNAICNQTVRSLCVLFFGLSLCLIDLTIPRESFAVSVVRLWATTKNNHINYKSTICLLLSGQHNARTDRENIAQCLRHIRIQVNNDTYAMVVQTNFTARIKQNVSLETESMSMFNKIQT